MQLNLNLGSLAFGKMNLRFRFRIYSLSAEVQVMQCYKGAKMHSVRTRERELEILHKLLNEDSMRPIRKRMNLSCTTILEIKIT